jgi:sn-glycerol 3-phosphate transport system substrate-binding protein
LVLLSGCGGGKEISSAGWIDKEGHITINFWYALGGSSGEVVEDLVEKFNESQDEITVVGTYQGGYAASMAKLWNALASNEPPAVAQIGAAPLVGSTGHLSSVTEFMERNPGFDPDEIWDVFWEYNSAGGKIWSMPFNNSVPVLCYNRDLFMEVGLDPVQPPDTFSEVIEYGQRLTVDTDDNGEIDQWGFNTRDGTHWFLSTMMLENGAEIVNEDETEVLYNSPEAVEMLALWEDLVNEYRIMPRNQHNEAKGDFLAGKLGMLLTSSASVPGFIQEAPFEVGVGMFPAVEGKERVVPVGGASLIVLEQDNALIEQAAWEFVEFMASKESSLYLSTHTGYLPIYKDVLNSPDMQDYLAECPVCEVPILALEYAEVIPVFTALGSSDAQLRLAVQKVELGETTPQEALDHAKDVTDRVIQENMEDQ